MDDVSGEIRRFEQPLESVSAPVSLLYLSAAVLAVAAVLVPMAGDVAHLVGYVLAAVVTPGTVIWFRAVKRQREREPLFISRLWPSRIAAFVLVAAVTIAVLHGFFYSRSTVLA